MCPFAALDLSDNGLRADPSGPYLRLFGVLPDIATSCALDLLLCEIWLERSVRVGTVWSKCTADTGVLVALSAIVLYRS